VGLYDKIPRELIIAPQKENGLYMWQQQWTNTGKGAVTKAFFPPVRNRVRQEIPIFPEFSTMVTFPEFSTMVTGHGKLKSYFYRFGLTDDPMCLCEEEEEEQTVEHLIFRLQEIK
jgi:hypothetical protein